MKLAEAEIAAELAQRADWSRSEEKWIVRKYRFPSFADAMRFTNRVAEIAERMNHHPFLAIDYKVVTVRLTSWHAGGLTKLDFASAAFYDEAFLAIKEEENG